ncbi:hypothetical protein KJ903_04230 [Patescibacteria group bacterium]|nr:hypothetical protein [Patescibacteria group bacterium]
MSVGIPRVDRTAINFLVKAFDGSMDEYRRRVQLKRGECVVEPPLLMATLSHREVEVVGVSGQELLIRPRGQGRAESVFIPLTGLMSWARHEAWQATVATTAAISSVSSGGTEQPSTTA